MTAAVGAVLVCGCNGQPGEKEKKSAERSVMTIVAEYPSATGESVYHGIVKEAHSINVGFKTAGQIKTINVREGQYVREGQLLAALDDKDYRLGVEALQIQYDQLKDEVARLHELYEKKSVSANDYEKADAGLRQLGIQLQVNKNKLEYTKLYAPVSGYVNSVNFSPSEMVDAGTPLFEMMDVSGLEVQADITASDYLERASFRTFTCRTASGETLPLTLSGIVPKADGNQLYKMTLRLPSGKGTAEFVPGTNVEVIVSKSATEQGSGALVLPSGAVRYDGGQYYVWTVGADSTLIRVNVSASASRESGKIIVKGIENGTEVVSAGAATLREGEKVRILAKPEASNVGGLL